MRTKKEELTFTEARIRDLSPRAARFTVHDTEVRRLSVRVSPAGHKVFQVVRRERSGQFRRYKLGTWPEMTVDAARSEATIYLGDVERGKSPAADRKRLREEETLADLWQRFLVLHAKVRKRSWRTDERRWVKHLSKHGTTRLSNVTTDLVSRWLAEIATNSGKGSANRVRALLFTMFEKGRREWGLLLPNPVRDAPRNPEKKKSRYLMPAEMRAFIRSLDEDHEDDVRDFWKLALFTGARSGSIATARWADFRLSAAAWEIPAESMKAGRELLLPLAPMVVELLQVRRERNPKADLVFPSRRRDGSLRPPRGGFKRVAERAGLVSFTPHDLRRSFATWALDAGAPLEVIARLLGHSPVPGMAVTGVYAQTHVDLLRRWVEITVGNMLRVAEMEVEEGKVLAFPGHGAVGQ